MLRIRTAVRALYSVCCLRSSSSNTLLGTNMEPDVKSGENCEDKRMKHVYDYVKLKELPNFADLNDEVQTIVAKSSWWEMYGVDWLNTFVTVCLGLPVSLLLMSSNDTWKLAAGMVVFGCCHGALSTKAGHAATHGAVAASATWNKFWSLFLVEFVGSFSNDMGYDMHIRSHHPHTNIIGMGDSSTWKMPFLPCYIYMFVTPLLVPVITPLVAIHGLWGKWRNLLRYLIVASSGLAINFLLLIKVSGFSLWGAVLCTFVARATLSIPYIHVNIFQHIGLPMYSQEDRPKRIYQMATGVLNLSRNPVLDWCFGHAILSCHVEHHLFPKLSDNMCMKIQPTVSKFLRQSGLPYNEDTYKGRLHMFIDQYEQLMVNAPPITHFVGLQ